MSIIILCLTCTEGHEIDRAMKLSSYMDDNNLTHAQMADRFKIERSHLTKLRSGKSKPSFDVLCRIHDGTRGQVTFVDFMQQLTKTKAAKK